MQLLGLSQKASFRSPVFCIRQKRGNSLSMPIFHENIRLSLRPVCRPQSGKRGGRKTSNRIYKLKLIDHNLLRHCDKFRNRFFRKPNDFYAQTIPFFKSSLALLQLMSSFRIRIFYALRPKQTPILFCRPRYLLFLICVLWSLCLCAYL